jgi:hypothetical protein
MSRATSPDLLRKSGIPVPKTRRSSIPTVVNSSLRQRTLPPPSPPTSPSDTSVQASPPRTISPRSPPLNIQWTALDRRSPTTDRFADSRAIERMASTESMRENERFSPIPWMMSPPGSPPPLSLYNSVAMLHYHIHGTSSPSTQPTETVSPFQTSATELATAMQILQGPQTTDTAMAVQSTAATAKTDERSEATGESRSPSTSPPRSPARVPTNVLPSSQPLEEFQAVEKAILASPYILPQDLLPKKSTTPSQQIQQPIADHNEDLSSSSIITMIKVKEGEPGTSMTKSKEEEFFAELKMRGSQGRSRGKARKKQPETPTESLEMSAFTEITAADAADADISDDDSLADLVADYSFRDDDDGELQSSPFLEYTRPKSPVLDEMDLSMYLKSPPSSPQRSFAIRSEENAMPEDTQVKGTTGGTTWDGDLKRNTSVQRRGQEYLSQFLARRKPSTTTPATTTPSTKLDRARKYTISLPSPFTILLSVVIILSLAANLFLFTKLYEYQSPRIPRLEDVMSPGKVGETFDIFTPSTKRWQLYHLKNKPVEVVPIAVPSRATRISYNWRQGWETWWKGYKWGGQRRRRIRWRHEERVIDVLGRAQIVVYGVLQRLLGL